jgi:hypothetical protein
MLVKNRSYPTLAQTFPICAMVRIVLFGLRQFAALPFARSPSSHGGGYAFSADRTNGLAATSLIPESFMKYPGQC